jgi:hypothetical protein
MALIDLYNLATDLAKKDQRAYISFREFSRSYNMAQNDFFIELIGNYKEYQPSLSVASKAPAKSQFIIDALSPFDKAAVVTVAANGLLTPPTDYHYFQAMYSINPQYSNKQCEDLPRGVTRLAPIRIVRHTEVANYMRSNRYLPSAIYPIAEQIGERFFVYPNNIGRVQFCYFAYPTPVVLGSTVVGTREVYNATTTTESKWKDQEEYQILKKTLAYLGVLIDNVDLIQFANDKDNKGV